MAIKVGDIVRRWSVGHYLLVLGKNRDEKGNWHYYCLNYNENKHVYSYLPRGLYDKVA